ncbi:DUF3040 domain-containing protein [Saccharothrix coeruleofusca]|uniref:DUF3040 family protein n=1 Tax=Saccharothrix coeruleofusca TaxID=33919 RepID=A0A918ARG5_9PSEU|nr:DUF3040 domain-containing protein [Saccharothrix coeruleofusca]GGP74053.1 hypothetical protein GCM10010185_54480 [Saccharothrix coeruleofusca]
MRWSLWLVLIGLLVVPLTRTPVGATAVATGLFTAGYGARCLNRRTGAQPRDSHAAVHTEAAVLTDQEQHLFRAIEKRLAAEDPEFAERFRALDRTGSRRATWLLTTAVLVSAVALIGLPGGPALAVVGVVIAATAFLIRQQPAAPRKRHHASGPDAPPAPGGSA